MTYYDPRQDPRYQQPQPAPAPSIDFGAIARTIGGLGLAGVAGYKIGKGRIRPRPEIAEAEAIRLANMARQPRQAPPAREAPPQAPAPQVQKQTSGFWTSAVEPRQQPQVQRVAEQPTVMMRSADPAQAVNTLAVTGRGQQGMDTSPTVRVQRINPGYIEQQAARQSFPMQGIPAVEMQYGRVTNQSLPIAMEKQGSFYTPQMLGIGKTKPIGVNQLLEDYEQAMDSFSGSAGDRLMTGDRRNGFEVVDPVLAEGIDKFSYDTAPQQWVNSRDFADTPYALNSSPLLPQRLIDSIDRNIMATRPSVDVTEKVMGYVEPRTLRMQTPNGVATQQVMGLETAQRIPESTPLRGSPLTLKEQLGLGASPLGSRELVEGVVPKAFRYQDGMDDAIQTAMAQQQGKGGYAMTTLPDENSMRLDKNYEANPQLMLPSTVIADNQLSPYDLTHGSMVKSSVLTAPSSVKANSGDERLDWMLRSGKIPNESGEYIETTPGYVKYIPHTQNVGDQYVETMTDAQAVRDRIASQAKKMNTQASISVGERQRFQAREFPDSTKLAISPNMFDSEQEAEAWLRARNGDLAEIPVNGQFYNTANMMTPNMLATLHNIERRGAVAQGNAAEMNRRREFTENAIADSYASRFNDSGVDPQRVDITVMNPDGSLIKREAMMTPDEQIAKGQSALAAGYGRLISYLPPNTVADSPGYDLNIISNDKDPIKQEAKRTQYVRDPNPVNVIRTNYPVVMAPNQIRMATDHHLDYNTGIQLR